MILLHIIVRRDSRGANSNLVSRAPEGNSPGDHGAVSACGRGSSYEHQPTRLGQCRWGGLPAGPIRANHHGRVSQTEITILRELLAADPEPVSGNRLAKQLGVSRVAIWMHLQKLAQQGFAFEARRSVGYRMTRTPSHLHAVLVKAYLSGRPRPPHLVCLDRVDSTNSEAERQLAAGCAVPLVILAREQTAGRGRRGRAWHSPAAGNLYSTFVFRPKLEPALMQDFTLWMGLNICELIANFCKLTPGLKWPNDLLLGDRKVGGMLTEARIDADQIRDLVFGLGLNLNGRLADLPRELQRTATTLAEVTGRALDLNRFAAALIGRVLTAYSQFVDGQYRDKFAELWARYDVLRGRPVSVTQGHRTFAGTATGIDDEGSLIVRLAGGGTERFRAGEVTLGRQAASA
ncbi:MAG TPA: biotin--[acetyl-CoA-carboxylase] ligase [Lacunisphaera sp.]|jgi:BirA family biotin operon repressor/biotin-[acetyl-CoA-carboxylase] ligase|nr:biotin--[acetyl-CoA-carboxylase] ligase [Lacunisphaera sp.]